ncbi:hypothetical protein M3194_15815 [Paenibacillus glycanilyticus]|uniref:hypothetical protein n=1 Tax=Paenibacillus glycanilyticus TaxID=126569 RepID=UPI0020414A1B|nr:hypothetical protein [Paenibacillus glycanilyticus]MCM3628811.1 hypothetical protein [Paenibacillus glycanilyticus]
MSSDMILSLSAVVAAYVSMVKAFGMPVKYASLVALAFAAFFVLTPGTWREAATTISIIGLSASGLYEINKKKSTGGSK